MNWGLLKPSYMILQNADIKLAPWEPRHHKGREGVDLPMLHLRSSRPGANAQVANFKTVRQDLPKASAA